MPPWQKELGHKAQWQVISIKEQKDMLGASGLAVIAAAPSVEETQK